MIYCLRFPFEVGVSKTLTRCRGRIGVGVGNRFILVEKSICQLKMKNPFKEIMKHCARDKFSSVGSFSGENSHVLNHYRVSRVFLS